MKMRLVTLLMLVLLAGCSKTENEDKFCWQTLDALGNEIAEVCGKTEAQMKQDYPLPCTYYKMGTNFCWYVDGNIFLQNKPEDYIDRLKVCYGYTTAVKVSCDYCQKWYSREKHLYKPSGSFNYQPVRYQQYCGDTVLTLFQGREIILRETPDSLITVKFSNNGIF